MLPSACSNSTSSHQANLLQFTQDMLWSSSFGAQVWFRWPLISMDLAIHRHLPISAHLELRPMACPSSSLTFNQHFHPVPLSAKVHVAAQLVIATRFAKSVYLIQCCIWSIYVLSRTYINDICWLNFFLSRTAQLPTGVNQMSTDSIRFHQVPLFRQKSARAYILQTAVNVEAPCLHCTPSFYRNTYCVLATRPRLLYLDILPQLSAQVAVINQCRYYVLVKEVDSI